MSETLLSENKIPISSRPAPSPLRVLMVSPVGECGGAEQVLLTLARSLPALGVEPILACLQPGPLMARAEQQGLRAYAFEAHRYRQPGMVWKAVRWLNGLVRSAQPDLLHSNHMGHLYSSPVCVLNRIPELWHVYDYPYRTDLMERFVQTLPCTRILFATERVKSGYPRLAHRPNSVVYPACIERERLLGFPAQPDIRQRLMLSDGPLFLTVARMQAHKGHHFLLQAIPDVLKTSPDAMFAIVGKAADEQQNRYLETLIEECETLGITKHVRFLGYTSDADLAALYREAAALVHPALSEGFGLTLIEAMLLGLPVIAAQADGPKEILGAPDAGLLVPTGDSRALALAMLRLLAHPAEAQALRDGGMRRAGSFKLETMVEETKAAYMEAVRPL